MLVFICNSPLHDSNNVLCRQRRASLLIKVTIPRRVGGVRSVTYVIVHWMHRFHWVHAAITCIRSCVKPSFFTSGFLPDDLWIIIANEFVSFLRNILANMDGRLFFSFFPVTIRWPRLWKIEKRWHKTRQFLLYMIYFFS